MKLTDDERQAANAGPRPPFRITKHWKSLLDGRESDPLRLQAIPSTAEWKTDRGELVDPLGEDNGSPLPRLIQGYRDRVLVLVTGICALYCRHCFRRRLTGEDFPPISKSETEEIAAWLVNHPEVREVILSGGDPLTLSIHELNNLIVRLRKDRPDLILRLATRIPIVDPQRISTRLVRKLRAHRPIWIVIQVNHPRELSPSALRAIEKFQNCGMPVVNQAVLLKGVNDDVDILEDLFTKLVRSSVKPYYLFQGDLAQGTGHFRLPLDEARKLVDELRTRIGGLAMPVFAVDIPGGGGKVSLGRDAVQNIGGGEWRLTTPEGKTGIYHDP